MFESGFPRRIRDCRALRLPGRAAFLDLLMQAHATRQIVDAWYNAKRVQTFVRLNMLVVAGGVSALACVSVGFCLVQDGGAYDEAAHKHEPLTPGALTSVCTLVILTCITCG